MFVLYLFLLFIALLYQAPLKNSFADVARKKMNTKSSFTSWVLDSFLADVLICNPTSKFFLVKDSLQPLVDAYDLPIENTEMEAYLAKQMLEGKGLTSIGDILLELKLLSSAFPNLSRLVTIAMTIAVSTAQCEHSFPL